MGLIEIFKKNSNSNLIKAIKKGNIDVIDSLINKGFDVNLKNWKGLTPLIVAVNNNQQQVVKFLIDNNSDINAKTKNLFTALMIAASKGHLEVVKLLIENGADVNAKDKYGTTALMGAVEKCYIEIVKLLIENGADITDESLARATVNNSTGIVKLLLENGANANIKIYGKKPLLIETVEEGQYRIVELLIKHGADVFVKYGASWMAIDYANNRLLQCYPEDQRRYKAIINMLISAEAKKRIGIELKK